MAIYTSMRQDRISINNMRLSSYVVKHDYGFAPNPYGGFLTLATCKPPIRRNAIVGDWIMGTGASSGIGEGRLIFVGQISATPTTEIYGCSSEFEVKIPILNPESELWRRRGDNIYTKNIAGQWTQRKNPFHGDSEFDHDISGLKVIVCTKFWYFGSEAPFIPIEFYSLVKKYSGYKNNACSPTVLNFLDWIHKFSEGVNGKPSSLMVQPISS